ncbi:MAG TPA: hypothetical protein VN203_13475 [Candidatus Acidoferrum sp.]|nr:hypothetical protein [Candidatus Acidoferrum sp.]
MGDRIPAKDLVPVESLATLDTARPSELVVGIPVLNHARSIAQVMESMAMGLAKHFPSRKAMLLVVDAGSQDGTREVIRSWKEKSPDAPLIQDVYLTGPALRGRATLAILLLVRHLEAQACALVDANLTSAAPAWVYQLLQPVLQGEADYISPVYTRLMSEGTLTTNLAAPLTRALYGKRIREVMGGCAGFSAKLASQVVEIDTRANDLDAYGMEMGLTTEALVSGGKVVETHLGRKMVIASPGEPDMATMLARVTGSLFGLMERYRAFWEPIDGSSPLPQTDMPASFSSEATEIHVERMVRAFRLGLKDLLPVWEQIMPEETLAHLYPLGLLPVDEFRFPPLLWARVVFDFAVAFHEWRLPREHLLRALTPLYLGRVAAFLAEAQDATPSQFSDLLDHIGQAFEEEKGSLRARWR